MKYIGTILVPFLVLLGGLGCSDLRSTAEERAFQAQNAKNSEKIVIGAAAPWDKIADLGYYREGLEMALDEINEQGIMGREMKILWRDDRASLSQGRIVAQEFSENPNVVAVIGHYNSFITEPVSLIYQHYGLLMMTATATDTDITEREGLNLIFRNIPNNKDVAAQLADFCRAKEYTRMVVYNVDNDFGNSLANAFENRANQVGINVIDRRSYDATAKAYQFKKITNTWREYYQFDALFLAGVVPQAAKFIVQCRKNGLEMPIVGGDGLDSPQLWEIGGQMVNGVIVGTYFHHNEPGPKVQKFTRDFVKLYGAKPDAWAAQAYDTLKVLAHAMQVAETTVPQEVATTLREMQPYQGVTGKIDFDHKGDVIDKSITTKVVRNQDFKHLGF